MGNDNYTKYIILGLVILLSIMFYNLGYDNAKAKYAITDIDILELPDTAYSKVHLDSIKSDIVKYDSILYELNVKVKEDVKTVYMLSDSASVELLKQLLDRANNIE